MNTLILQPSDTMRGLEGVVVDLESDPEPSYDALQRTHGRFDVVVGAPAIWVDDEDSSEDEEFVMAVEILQPSVFVLETVRGLAGPKYADFLEALVADLAEMGYTVEHSLVNLGGRRRLVIIGHLGRHSRPVFRTRRGARGPSTIRDIIKTNLEDAA